MDLVRCGENSGSQFSPWSKIEIIEKGSLEDLEAAHLHSSTGSGDENGDYTLRAHHGSYWNAE